MSTTLTATDFIQDRENWRSIALHGQRAYTTFPITERFTDQQIVEVYVQGEDVPELTQHANSLADAIEILCRHAIAVEQANRQESEPRGEVT